MVFWLVTVGYCGDTVQTTATKKGLSATSMQRLVFFIPKIFLFIFFSFFVIHLFTGKNLLLGSVFSSFKTLVSLSRYFLFYYYFLFFFKQRISMTTQKERKKIILKRTQ